MGGFGGAGACVCVCDRLDQLAPVFCPAVSKRVGEGGGGAVSEDEGLMMTLAVDHSDVLPEERAFQQVRPITSIRTVSPPPSLPPNPRPPHD